MATRPLGPTQISLLRCLDDPPYHYERGVWGPRSGWTFGTKISTERMFQTLEKRGLISCTPSVRHGEGPTYRLTPEGEASIVKLKANGWKPL